MDLFGKEPRPQWNDKMLDELANKVGEEVHEWCSHETDLEDCVCDCKEILKWHLNDNGYEIATKFERKGYSPDMELVELLNGISYDASAILDKFVKLWVKTDNIKLDLPISENVTIKIRGELIKGKIVKHYEETAKYGVSTKEDSSSHYLIKFEDIISETQSS